MKREYKLQLSCTAVVKGYLTVFAESELEAGTLALEQANEGNIVWRYAGLVDESNITVDDCWVTYERD